MVLLLGVLEYAKFDECGELYSRYIICFTKKEALYFKTNNVFMTLLVLLLHYKDNGKNPFFLTKNPFLTYVINVFNTR
jgi:hypothetical protein